MKSWKKQQKKLKSNISSVLTNNKRHSSKGVSFFMLTIFVFFSLNRTSDFVALDACGAYSSVASLKKVGCTSEMKINTNLFCISLGLH